MLILGCIADDFTGASDAASFLVRGGFSVRLYNGIPEECTWKKDNDQSGEVQGIVIALKSRTQETKGAVADTLKAAQILLEWGAKQLYFKYCSTFDSTPKGNIGPVADALIDFMKVPYTLLCPSLPSNGRTVESGKLMVNGIPLHESPMKNHPLTPMWDCRIDQLMKPQSRYLCRNLSIEELSVFPADARSKDPFYIIPDYKNPADGEKIAAMFGQVPLLTGGSGLLESLARNWTKKLSVKGKIPESGTRGKALLLAGSCSKVTLDQIEWYQNLGKYCYQLDPKGLIEGEQTVDAAWAFAEEHSSESDTVLIYSSDTPEKVRESQKLGVEIVASVLENAMAALAVKAIHAGYTRIISAGGETSGAVTKELGFSSYWIGESVAPGVPIMIPTERLDIRLILKSGNFGQENFFEQALVMTLR